MASKNQIESNHASELILHFDSEAVILPSMKNFPLPLFLLIFASGCAHTLTAKEKSDFEDRVNEQAFHSQKTLPPSKTNRVKLAVGQWATIETIFKDDKGGVKSMSLSTYKVIQIQGDTVSLEIESWSAGRTDSMTLAFVVKHLPLASTKLGMTEAEAKTIVDQMEFQKIITQNGKSAPQEIPTNLIVLTKPYAKNLMLTGLTEGSVKSEACSSDYLKSTKCLAYDFSSDALGHTIQGHVDTHSSIPIVGFIKLESDQYTSSVIAYGMSGAEGKLLH